MRNVNTSTGVCRIWLNFWSFYPRKQLLLHFALKHTISHWKCYVYTTYFNTSISMLVVVSTACCSPQIMETTVAPNFTSVPILLRFLWHGEKTGVWTFVHHCTRGPTRSMQCSASARSKILCESAHFFLKTPSCNSIFSNMKWAVSLWGENPGVMSQDLIPIQDFCLVSQC